MQARTSGGWVAGGRAGRVNGTGLITRGWLLSARCR